MSSSFLSASEQARLNRFPEQISHEDLITFFTLSDKDTTVVAKQRGSTNRLGFALQICALRYLGFAPDDLSTALVQIGERRQEKGSFAAVSG